MSEQTGKHEYDGIQELNNSLPRWWIIKFYLTIAFSVLYFGYYIMGSGPTLVEEYEQDIKRLEIAQLQQASQVPKLDEAQLAALVKRPDVIAKGKAVFLVRCVSCHGAHAEGGIGPNLTDKYWKNGNGKLTDLVEIVTKGVLANGMPAWGTVIAPDEVQAAVAYVKSLAGTHPPNAKQPEGKLIPDYF